MWHLLPGSVWSARLLMFEVAVAYGVNSTRQFRRLYQRVESWHMTVGRLSVVLYGR